MHGQDLTKLWKRSSANGLLKIARDIESQGTWRGYLSVPEHEVFKKVIDQGGDQWARFLDGKVSARVEVVPAHTHAANTASHGGGPGINSPRRGTPVISATPLETSTPRTPSVSLPNSGTPQPAVTELDPLTVCFRVRYMLYEKAIGVLYPSTGAAQEFDFALLEEEDEPDKVNDKTAPAKPVRRTDDDYDEDDYDEEEDEPENNKVDEKEDENNTQEDSITDALTFKVSITNEDEALMTKQAAANYNKLYHIFEGDWENALKQRKLEESDRQMDMDANGGQAGPGGGTSTSSAAASFGAANLSLKHLLATIETKRDELQLTDLELRNLISDVRKNRSKWASEDKIGQEELYEACEKVVLELRGYTEHSTAFLNKVNKRDAPNYYNIIKHPMDLNTVMKKLKTFQYKSKQEFVSDLMLIWKNCLTYNTDPKHFLRGHAYAMQKKTLSLIPLIPDIVVRDRAEVEAEEQAALANGTANNNSLGAESEREEESGGLMRTSRKGAGKHSGKGRKRKLEEADDETPDPERENESDTNNNNNSSNNNNATINNNNATTTINNSDLSRTNSMLASPLQREATPNTGTPGADYDSTSVQGQVAEEPSSDQEDNENADVETQVWRSKFNHQRAVYCCKRDDLFKDNKIQKDVPAALRRQFPMTKFDETMNYPFGDGSEDQQPKRIFSRAGLLESIESDKKPFLLEYEVGSGVPAVPWALDAKNEDDGMQHLQPEDIKPSNYISRGGLNQKMNNNLTEMQQIRKVCSKISLIRQMQQQSYMHNTNAKPYNPPEIEDVDLDIESRLPNRDEFNGAVSAAALKKSVGKIAMHTGFEVTEFMAIDALTEITADYMGKIAKTLKMFMEATNSEREYSFEDILLMTLNQNGIDSLSSLELYVQDDIDRHGSRLKDLGRKLTSFLGDLLRPAASDLNESFQDNSEQFLNGDFASQIGDEMDFFGFRELGLDKELGLLTSTVPLHLLHSRFNASLTSQSTLPEDSTKASLCTEEYPAMDRKHAQNQIGLLRPFFLAKLDSTNGEALLEGDNLPPKQRNTRPKLPPTGKISGPKKKPISKGFFLKEHEPEMVPNADNNNNNNNSGGGVFDFNEENDNDMAMKLENEIENANREDMLGNAM